MPILDGTNHDFIYVIKRFAAEKHYIFAANYFSPKMTVTVDAIEGLKERVFALGRYL
jgi:hypothetical protein